MIHSVLRAIGGIGVFDTISICLFVTVFCGVIIWAARLQKPFLKQMSSLPLHEEDDGQKKGEPTHE
jgi:hypothetical protein